MRLPPLWVVVGMQVAVLLLAALLLVVHFER